MGPIMPLEKKGTPAEPETFWYVYQKDRQVIGHYFN